MDEVLVGGGGGIGKTWCGEFGCWVYRLCLGGDRNLVSMQSQLQLHTVHLCLLPSGVYYKYNNSKECVEQLLVLACRAVSTYNLQGLIAGSVWCAN